MIDIGNLMCRIIGPGITFNRNQRILNNVLHYSIHISIIKSLQLKSNQIDSSTFVFIEHYTTHGHHV